MGDVRDSEFEGLYRAYAGRVRAYVLRRAGAAVADDVVADVFVVAWRRRGDVPEDAPPWLLGVARRVLANRRRGERRALALRDRLGVEQRGTRGEPAGFDGRVICALERLSDRDRELLMLIAWEGLGQTDVARVLGIRQGTLAMRLHRARQRFAEALAAEDQAIATTEEVSR